MGQSQLSIICPQRVGGYVLYDYLFATVGSRPAGTRRRSDHSSIDGFGIGLRKTGRTTMPQPTSVFQQYGRQRAVGLLFHQSAQAVENLRQGVSFCDHFQDSFFPCKQGFSSLAIFNVTNDSEPFDNASLLVPQGHTAVQKPAILPVSSSPEAYLILEGLRRRERGSPLLQMSPKIVGVNCKLPIPADGVFG